MFLISKMKFYIQIVYYNFENLGTIIPKRGTEYILHTYIIVFFSVINFENYYIIYLISEAHPNIL